MRNIQTAAWSHEIDDESAASTMPKDYAYTDPTYSNDIHSTDLDIQEIALMHCTVLCSNMAI